MDPFDVDPPDPWAIFFFAVLVIGVVTLGILGAAPR